MLPVNPLAHIYRLIAKYIHLLLFVDLIVRRYNSTGVTFSSAIPTQQYSVAVIDTLNGTAYLWQGDQWQSALDGIKGHDLPYWATLSFKNNYILIMKFPSIPP